MSNKEFWDVIKPFLANSDMSLIQNNVVVADEQELTEIFNDCYINLVEKSNGRNPLA